MLKPKIFTTEQQDVEGNLIFRPQNVRLIQLDIETGETKQTLYQNIITDLYLDLLKDAALSSAFDPEIKYFAWGSGTTAAAIGDVKLETEIGRKQITSVLDLGLGQWKTIIYLGPSEAVGQIEEVAWFAGPDASASADSGLCVSRVLISKLKTALESFQVERTDTVGRV